MKKKENGEVWEYVISYQDLIFREMHRLNIHFNFEDILHSVLILLFQKLQQGVAHSLNGVVVRSAIIDVLKVEYRYINIETPTGEIGELVC